MRCDGCGHECDADAMFCNVCGRRIVTLGQDPEREESGASTFHEVETELGSKEEPHYFHSDALNISLSKQVFWSWIVLAVLFMIPAILLIYLAGSRTGAICLTSLTVLGVALALLLVMMNRGEL